MQDVWEIIEQAPKACEATADLYHWSANYAAGDGPFALFLDMIGWSAEELGMPCYGPTVRAGENRVTEWDAHLGYVELGKLGAALNEYADNPHDIRAFVDTLMMAEAA